MSFVPASVKVPVNVEMAVGPVPKDTRAGTAVTLGTTFVTLMLLLSTPVPPEFVTISVTT